MTVITSKALRMLSTHVSASASPITPRIKQFPRNELKSLVFLSLQPTVAYDLLIYSTGFFSPRFFCHVVFLIARLDFFFLTIKSEPYTAKA